jgi:hypothetical protein
MAGAVDIPSANNIQGAWLGQTSAELPFRPADAAAITSSGLSDAGTFVLAETALDMHCWGENPVVTAKLQLNGQDRFSEREGSYFDVVQPYQHHTRAPDTGINVYSFALRPEEHQPSGSCNFSRIDNAVLQLVLSSPTVSGTATAKVRVYAVNYNVLRVMSGIKLDILVYVLYQLIKNCAEKQPATNKSGSVCGNFGLTPVVKVSC